MTAEFVEDLLEIAEDEAWIFDDDWSDDVDYDRPIGRCANCGDTIFRGQGGPTVHDFCQADFVWYLNHPDTPWSDD